MRLSFLYQNNFLEKSKCADNLEYVENFIKQRQYENDIYHLNRNSDREQPKLQRNRGIPNCKVNGVTLKANRIHVFKLLALVSSVHLKEEPCEKMEKTNITETKNLTNRRQMQVCDFY